MNNNYELIKGKLNLKMKKVYIPPYILHLTSYIKLCVSNYNKAPY